MNEEISLKERRVVEALVRALPELEPCLHQHVAESHGEINAYILLPDMVRELGEMNRCGQLPADALLRLSKAAEGVLCVDDFDVDNLVGLGLLQELLESPLWTAFQTTLGERSAAVLRSLDLIEPKGM